MPSVADAWPPVCTLAARNLRFGGTAAWSAPPELIAELLPDRRVLTLLGADIGEQQPQLRDRNVDLLDHDSPHQARLRRRGLTQRDCVDAELARASTIGHPSQASPSAVLMQL